MKIRLQQNRIASSEAIINVADEIIGEVQKDPLDAFRSDADAIEAAQALGAANSGAQQLEIVQADAAVHE